MTSTTESKSQDLLKLDIPAPRYTSYPTVPYWENNLDEQIWKTQVAEAFKEQGREGSSLYIHLPFCESLCTYCACNTRITVNHGVEQGYINALLKEWEMYQACFAAKPLLREIHLGGGTPTFFSPANLAFLMQSILSSARMHEDADFSFEGHPANTSREHLQALYDLGFRRVSFGVQDFDPRVQDTINRYQSHEQVQQVMQWARAIGYRSVNVDLVYGLPCQSPESVGDTINKVISLRPERIAFYSYAHVPWLKPGQRKYSEKDLPSDREKRALYDLGRTLLCAAGYTDVGMDHFALPGDELLEAAKKGTLHRNFMGYTAKHTKLMIGLGASSIGDSWGAFGQNAKVVEDYLERVNSGHLPIIRGHVLNEEDRILRKEILDLMCRYACDLDARLDHSDILERLRPFEERGMLERTTNTLRICESGKAWLRHIGLCFDRRYWSKIPEKAIFSKTA